MSYITQIETFLPEKKMTAGELSERTGLSEEIVREKLGVDEKRVSGEYHVSELCEKAAEKALEKADITAEDLDLVLYHGSEYKDYLEWSVSVYLTEKIGAENAYATEEYGLCAGTPLALRRVKSQIESGDIDNALLVSASIEDQLINYKDKDSSFIFNLGSGASAMILRSESENPKAKVMESDAYTDGSFSKNVKTTEGSRKKGKWVLEVENKEKMAERLNEISLENFNSVVNESIRKSGLETEDLDFAALTHVKPSFHRQITDSLNVESFYLRNYGHVQSVDQPLTLEKAEEKGILEEGDIISILAAGTGYTWASTIIEWKT